ncbi:MAG: MFS transporter [Actinomycetota bacterium]|nr:MFS transporter [Actinomycetota bacterium]
MRRLLFLTCAIVLVDTVFYAVLVPLVPYYSGEFGLSKTMVGVLNGSFGVGVLVGSAPAGYLAARIGVKPTALYGLALLAITSLAFGFAGKAWLLVLLRFGEGFGSALSWVAAFTWIVAWAPEERRGQMIGTLISAAVVGALIGPALGGAAEYVGVILVFAAVAVLGSLVAAWTVLTPAPAPEGTPPDLRALGAVLRPRLASGIWLIALSPLLFSILAVLSPLQFDRLGWGPAAIGAVFLVGAAVEAAVHPLIGRWSDRSGYRPPVFTGVAASIFLLCALPWTGGVWPLALLVVLAAAFFNFSLTPGTALFTSGAEKAGIGQALGFGLTNFAWASGYAVGAPLGGILADLRGDVFSYVSLAVVCLLTLVALWRAI